jgi:hypothetical protein
MGHATTITAHWQSAGHEQPQLRTATARCGFTIPGGLVKLPQRKGARRSLNLWSLCYLFAGAVISL